MVLANTSAFTKFASPWQVSFIVNLTDSQCTMIFAEVSDLDSIASAIKGGDSKKELATYFDNTGNENCQ